MILVNHNHKFKGLNETGLVFLDVFYFVEWNICSRGCTWTGLFINIQEKLAEILELTVNRT